MFSVSLEPVLKLSSSALIPNDKSNLEKAIKIYDSLIQNGVDVLLDDFEEYISNKFKKHDLIGIPLQIIVGSKSKEDEIEFKEIDGDSKILNVKNILEEIKKYLA